ncbi:MAG: 4Fe-4S dicluster domain-containing protein, partial [Holophagales bacterium]|nr:4Fe-4S dicluster domain-containing protein [Holophagales bacterium]
MSRIIRSEQDLCTGCSRCVRKCPMEMANITYQDNTGKFKVAIDDKQCISCGRCLSTCKHGARLYTDDTERFFNDLSNGVPISLIAAPSIKTNIPEWKRLFTYLKRAGVKKIYDVSLGADICIWGHIRYMEKSESVPLITQPCPVIVSYCEIYQHDLLKNLSPLHSPMACIAIYMKEYEGIADKIAAISPCIAKTSEFEATGLADYNITFSKLREYLKERDISLPDEETTFDHYESALGSLFPMPGGLKENIEFFLGKNYSIDSAEGYDVFNKLTVYANSSSELLPNLFDVLNCESGCNMSVACSQDL